VVARARNVGHEARLRQLGVAMIERETLHSALMSARSVLETLGWERHTARTLAMRFLEHNRELVATMTPHIDDESRLIAIARQGRDQLERQWAQERQQLGAKGARDGWPGEGTDR
jgi:glutathione-regulated potassium-efflux system ancillary protein KefC